MAAIPRYLKAQIEKDLNNSMVFVAGPRQVGKTTLARTLPGADAGYLSWEIAEDRARIIERDFPESPLWIFDELHKYEKWRDYLKGLYDESRTGRRISASQKILAAGSGRLDLYRYGGDSLQGRYYLLRLHPLTVAELGLATSGELHDLLRLSGFPEPFLSGQEAQAQQWSRSRRARIADDDIRSLERVLHLGQIQTLMHRLPQYVGSPLSINALCANLRASHKAVSSWLDILERLYFIFRLPPLGGPSIRAVKKERKHYHFDWSAVGDEAARFENLVACHLLKWVHFKQDTEGLAYALHYFRDTAGQEVDFVVTERRNPIMLVECAWSDADVSKSLRYLKGKFPEADAWQVSAVGTKDCVNVRRGFVRVAPALKLLRTLV